MANLYNQQGRNNHLARRLTFCAGFRLKNTS